MPRRRARFAFGGTLLQHDLLRIRRSATTGSLFGSNLTKKTPHGWFADSGRSRLISWIFAALAIDPEFFWRVLEEGILEVVRVQGQSSSSRKNSRS